MLQPGQLRETELPEFPLRGPFGGIQSEVSPDEIEQLGFYDCVNVTLRKSNVTVRTSYNALTAMPNPQEPINGIADFFTNTGARVQVIITPTRLLKWDGAANDWVVITGTLTGAITDLFSWTVVNHKLLFSQGVDKVQLWDGITAGFADASVNAVPARYAIELATHVLVADTIEGGNRFHQRVRWTGSGDPTDWISFNAGVRDNIGDLGPITGLVKLYQTGYAFHQWGITQIIPTGIGTKPFDFQPISANKRGCICPFSIAPYGEFHAPYVGGDNIYLFNGTESIPIGDAPIDGNRRVGARRRIMGELLQADFGRVYGYTTAAINGNDFNAYWLSIPGGNTWVYNFDENNWTRWVFNKTVRSIGRFAKAGQVRIIDLVGLISEQQWTPATLTNTNPFDGVLLGFTDGTPGYVDFTNYSEQSWSISSGQLVMGDRRHSKTIERFRLIIQDLGSVTFDVTVTNERGQTKTQSVTLGTGSGLSLMTILPFKINGMFLRWTVSGSAAAKASFVEFTPIYAVGGEAKIG